MHLFVTLLVRLQIARLDDGFNSKQVVPNLITRLGETKVLTWGNVMDVVICYEIQLIWQRSKKSNIEYHVHGTVVY